MKRYPIDPLERFVRGDRVAHAIHGCKCSVGAKGGRRVDYCMSVAEIGTALGTTGRQVYRLRKSGLSIDQAFVMADAVRVTPYALWPEMVDDFEEERRAVKRSRQAKWFRERYRTDPAFRAANRERNAAYRAEVIEWDRRRQRTPEMRAIKRRSLAKTRGTPEGRAAYNTYMREWRARKKMTA